MRARTSHSKPQSSRKFELEPELPRGVFERIVSRLDSAALVGNYNAIKALVPGQAILPMLKADAYGHDAEWVARHLLAQPDLYGFGLATLLEGAALRKALGPRSRKLKLVVFSGAGPWSEEKGQFCEQNGLTPVIGSDDDWHRFLRGGWEKKIPYEIKFNTGMNRLGLSPGMARTVVRALKDRPSEHFPQAICSHLALAESPDHRLSLAQRDCFAQIRRELSGAFPAALFHLANSAAIWNQNLWRLDGFTDLVRPGLALYGVVPWKGAQARGIQPVMTLEAEVVTVRALKPGDAVGYGAAYTAAAATRGAPIYGAVVSAGYADGLMRALESSGQAWVQNSSGGYGTRFMGRISMDLSTIHCTAGTRPGDRVQLLGPQIDPWAQAQAAGTIPYELLTSVSPRVQRIYE